MKTYKAIFFDWDGTAVMSRKAPAEEAVAAMKPLLEKGVKLAVISGTTYENIAGGAIERYFTEKELENLYLGLGRGAYNYAFKGGKPYVFSHCIPDKEVLEKIHRICFEIHMELKNRYGFNTDIVFSRPNYCKIDLMVENNRGDNLFMQENELELLKESLKAHGIDGGLQALIDLSHKKAADFGIKVAPTCDAKYLEVGISSKSDNADTIFTHLQEELPGLMPQDCSFWGDEYVGIEEGIFGSDSFMCTKITKDGDFFDVSDVPGERPHKVQVLGGSVQTFLDFLGKQAGEA
ncbi:MAG: HAD hydrolase family protein [Lachnospiraceae bacterium]|nr:HAD hydrolase family protein [Lachnospiraceae bacterium]